MTVTLLGTGNVPVPGKTVILSQGSGQSTIIPAASPNMTDANGVATFTVTDSHVETVTYTAEDTSDSPTVTVNATATVEFEAPEVDAANSTLASSLSNVPSGQSDTITVTLRDQAFESPTGRRSNRDAHRHRQRDDHAPTRHGDHELRGSGDLQRHRRRQR